MDTDLIVEASIAAVKQEALKQAGDDHPGVGKCPILGILDITL